MDVCNVVKILANLMMIGEFPESVNLLCFLQEVVDAIRKRK